MVRSSRFLMISQWSCLLMLAVVCLACAPKFNHQDAAKVASGFTYSPNAASLANSGASATASTTTGTFTLSHTQLGQTMAVSSGSSAHFSMVTRGLAP
jgi:hypothetical protein